MKIRMLLAATALLVSLTACGSSVEPGTTLDTERETTAAQTRLAASGFAAQASTLIGDEQPAIDEWNGRTGGDLEATVSAYIGLGGGLAQVFNTVADAATRFEWPVGSRHTTPYQMPLALEISGGGVTRCVLPATDEEGKARFEAIEGACPAGRVARELAWLGDVVVAATSEDRDAMRELIGQEMNGKLTDAYEEIYAAASRTTGINPLEPFVAASRADIEKYLSTSVLSVRVSADLKRVGVFLAGDPSRGACLLLPADDRARLEPSELDVGSEPC